ncbi:hypothetical protein CDAR_184561 [Caerostris darwini]|uniref:CRAL/TRIO N-terminal domain-containing protein n=1 Tax=Caerostris darwini TaxID=1538125 RepID=A0AAV4RLT7_9ARAC|nr:hypothetical protein CDAR_184561 [Caerostris darwini]
MGIRDPATAKIDDEHTKNIEFDDDFLLHYLRVRKYNVARAFTQLKALVALKKKHPLMFTNFSYDKTVKAAYDKDISVLPWRCQDGCAVLLVELDNWNPEELPVEEIKRASILYLAGSLRNLMIQINGFKVIYDLKSNPLRHVKYCTPKNLYLLYHGTQRRARLSWTREQVSWTRQRWAPVLITDDFRFTLESNSGRGDGIRMIFHKTPKTLLNYFPKAVLPKQYGGDLQNYDMSSWLKKAMAPEKLAALGGRPRQMNES